LVHIYILIYHLLHSTFKNGIVNSLYILSSISKVTSFLYNNYFISLKEKQVAHLMLTMSEIYIFIIGQPFNAKVQRSIYNFALIKKI